LNKIAKANAAERRRVQKLVDSWPDITRPEIAQVYREEILNEPEGQYERSCAIHESAHMIITYAVGGTTVLDANTVLSIVTDNSLGTANFGVARAGARGLSPVDDAAIDFSGPIGARTAFPNVIDSTSFGDAVGIFYGGACLKHPELRVKHSSDQLLEIVRECGNEPFLNVMVIMEKNKYEEDRLKSDEQIRICKRHLDAIHALVNFPPEQLETNGIPEYFAGFDGFELLRPIAARSWALVRENFSKIERLADEIQRRKTMSGREVHEFVTRTLAVIA
jgi:hypothetical protein